MAEYSFFLSSVLIPQEYHYWKNTLDYIFFQLSLGKTDWFLKDFIFTLHYLANRTWPEEEKKII